MATPIPACSALRWREFISDMASPSNQGRGTRGEGRGRRAEVRSQRSEVRGQGAAEGWGVYYLAPRPSALVPDYLMNSISRYDGNGQWSSATRVSSLSAALRTRLVEARTWSRACRVWARMSPSAWWARSL